MLGRKAGHAQVCWRQAGRWLQAARARQVRQVHPLQPAAEGPNHVAHSRRVEGGGRRVAGVTGAGKRKNGREWLTAITPQENRLTWDKVGLV